MEKLNTTWIINSAREKLNGKDSRTMAMFHTGIMVAAALVITVLQYVLAEGIGNTSGLSGLGTRSVLETIQTVLRWANLLLVPFWGLGFVYAALLWAREKDAHRRDLLTGFRRWGAYLGVLLNRTLLSFFVMMFCVNISSMVYMLTPASGVIENLSATTGADMDALAKILTEMTPEQISELMYAMIPLLLIWVVVSAAILIPLLYRFRLAEYVILDEPRARGMSAMFLSAIMLRRRCWQLFRLDLRFWWYYGLKLLCLLICYADLLLMALGISLPISADAVYLLTYGIYLVGLFAVEVSFRPLVDTSYAVAFETIKEMGPVQKKTVEKPEDMPWDEE